MSGWYLQQMSQDFTWCQTFLIASIRSINSAIFQYVGKTDKVVVNEVLLVYLLHDFLPLLIMKKLTAVKKRSTQHLVLKVYQHSITQLLETAIWLLWIQPAPIGHSVFSWHIQITQNTNNMEESTYKHCSLGVQFIKIKYLQLTNFKFNYNVSH